MLRRSLLLTALLVALALVGCSGGQKPSQTPPTGSGAGTSAKADVEIKEFAFNPATIEINAGQTVVWTNADTVQHQLTGSGGIDSPTLNQGETYAVTFGTAGTYDYSCSIHPTMKGTVVVK